MLSLFGALLLAALSAEYFFSRSTSYFLDAIAAFATTFQDSLVATDCDAIEAYLTTSRASFATCILDAIEPYAATIAALATTFFDANAAAFSTTTIALVAHSCALKWAVLWPYAVCLVLFRRHVSFSKAGLALLGLSMLEYCITAELRLRDEREVRHRGPGGREHRHHRVGSRRRLVARNHTEAALDAHLPSVVD